MALCSTLLAVFLAVGGTDASQEQPSGFLDGFPDIPLLEGFKEIDNAHMVFDTPGGTIAKSRLESSFGDGLIRYAQTLKALGWACRQMDQLTCSRGSDRLVVRIVEQANNNTIYMVTSEPDR